MVIYTAGDIFKAKVDYLLGEIEWFKVYSGDTLVIDKGGFYHNIENIRVIFYKLCATGLKVNATKCSFVLQ